MSILPPHLDPFATGDFDTRCYWCNEANLDNAETQDDMPCPVERYGRTICAGCCVRLHDEGDELGVYCADCHDATSVPTRAQVSAATPPTQITTSASSDPVAALTNTIEIEHCDECGAMQPVHEFSQVIGYGLLCPRCVDELRNTGLAS